MPNRCAGNYLLKIRTLLAASAIVAACPDLAAQAPTAPPSAPQPTPTLTVQSRLVEVPTLVTTRAGQIVFALTAPDFYITDNGIPQPAHLSQDTDSEPLALAIVVPLGGAGAAHLRDYAALNAVLEDFVGAVEHRVEVIGFDSEPRILLPWTDSIDAAAGALGAAQPGNGGAALLDGVRFAVDQLQTAPPSYRRAILLLSETVDGGSSSSINDTLRAISDANTAVYAIAFSSARAAVHHEASKFNQDTPGPAKGCFSREGADAEYNGHYSKQVLDCISQLLPPVRLGTMAFLAAHDSLRADAPESMASLTGGAFARFKDAKGVKAGLITMTRQVPNRYVLSFTPSAPTEGLHALKVELPDHPGLELHYRTEYWVTPPAPPAH